MAPADLPRPLRLLLLVLVAGALLAALVLGLRPSPVDVELVAVERGTVPVELAAEGRVRLGEVHRVRAPLPGELHRPGLRPGDLVVPGQGVALLSGAASAAPDPREEARQTARLAAREAEVQAGEARLEAARAWLEAAELELREVRVRREEGGASALDEARARGVRDEAAAGVRGAEAGVALARAGVAAVEAELGGVADGGGRAGGGGGAGGVHVVRAPVGGQVLAVVRESGGPVAAGELLLEVGGGEPEVVVELSSRQAVRLAGWVADGGGGASGAGSASGARSGAVPATVAWGPSRARGQLAGELLRLEPAGRPGTSVLGGEESRVRAVVRLPRPAPGLLHGGRVDVTFHLEERPDRLRLPVGAVVRRGGRDVVLVARGGRLEEREVAVELRTPAFTELRSGVEPGERVVHFPPDRAAEGVRYRVAGGGG